MLLSRVASFTLRFLEFASSVIVLGLASWFIHRRNTVAGGPKGRLIYTDIIATLSTIVSLLWLLPFTFTFMHYPIDLFLSLAWFASFGAVYQYLHRGTLTECASLYGGNLSNSSPRHIYCQAWRTLEGFTFMLGLFYLGSALLSMYVFHRLRARKTVHSSPPATATTTAV